MQRIQHAAKLTSQDLAMRSEQPKDATQNLH